jgi:Phosphotransferase enzyme family
MVDQKAMNQGTVQTDNLFPDRWESISPAWVTKAIAGHHPDAEVAAVTTLMRDDGTNRRLKLGVTYTKGSGPDTLFLKANEPAHRSVHLRNGNLFNEAQLFASGVPLIVEHPLVYQSLLDKLEGNFLLVMEDVTGRGADPRDATRPMSVNQVANGLRSLARMHSHYWGFSSASDPRLQWVQTWAPSHGWQEGLKSRIPKGLLRAAGILPNVIAGFDADETVRLWARYVASLRKGPVTLLHADAHIGNTYLLPDDTVGFLDWQVVRWGEWSQDVGYFLVSALTPEDRRDSERELLEVYRAALEIAAQKRPSREEMWLRYRTTPAYGLAIWLSTLGTDGWQSQEISSTLVQRFSSAFVELDTLNALRTSGI